MSRSHAPQGQGDHGTVYSRWVGAQAGTSRPLRAPVVFGLVGIEWARPNHVRIELRARRVDGGWSRWVPAATLGHDADGDERVGPAQYGEPIWTGACDAVQLRSSARVEGLTVHFVAAATDPGLVATAAAAPPLAQPILDAGPGQPPIIARRAWAGAGRGPALPPGYGDVRLAFVHHSDGPNGYSAAEVPAMLRAIYDFHRYVRGWGDIGYNFAVDLYGRIWEARAGGIDQAVVGAQAGGYNLESTGAVVLGTFSDVVPGRAAMRSLESLLAWKLSLHGLPTTGKVTVEVDPPDAFYTRFAPGAKVSLPRVAGHRDGCTTDCPGDALYRQLPSVRPVVARLAGVAAVITIAPSGGQDFAPKYLSLAAAELVAGESVALSGVLSTLDGPALAGAPVELQSVTGAGAEQTLASTVSDAAGGWTVTLSPTANALLRALHRPAPATASPLVVVAVAPALSVTQVSQSPLTLGGTVTPAKAKVTIDVYDAAGNHQLVHHASVPASGGDFQARLRLPSGRYWVRARTVADALNIAGESARLTVVV